MHLHHHVRHRGKPTPRHEPRYHYPFMYEFRMKRVHFKNKKEKVLRVDVVGGDKTAYTSLSAIAVFWYRLIVF